MAFISRAASALFAASVIFGVGCAADQQSSPSDITGKGSGSGQGSGSGSGTISAGFIETDLVSDQAGRAKFQDPDMINAWGLARDQQAFWIADNGSGKLSVVDQTGAPSRELPKGLKPDLGPGITGVAINTSSSFQMHTQAGCGAAAVLVSNEKGQILGINNALSDRPLVLVDRSAEGAVYKGLAIINVTGVGMELLATDFHNGGIDVFDGNFNLISQPQQTGSGSGSGVIENSSGSGSTTPKQMFFDANLEAGFAPFNVVAINDKVYVTYAKQDPNKQDDVAAAGAGRIDEFDLKGNLIRVIADGGLLDAPYGIALAPANFCSSTANKLLVGNFGDGTIVAIDDSSARPHVLGQLLGKDGNALRIDGLWSLMFGDGQAVGQDNALYFTAGPDHEKHGLFGYLMAAENTGKQ